MDEQFEDDDGPETEKEKTLRAEVNKAFYDDRVEMAEPGALRRWLKTLSTKRTPSSNNWSRDIIRAAFINHVQHTRFVADLDARNNVLQQANFQLQEKVKRLTCVGVIFAALAFIFAAIQGVYAVRSYNLARQVAVEGENSDARWIRLSTTGLLGSHPEK